MSVDSRQFEVKGCELGLGASLLHSVFNYVWTGIKTAS